MKYFALTSLIVIASANAALRGNEEAVVADAGEVMGEKFFRYHCGDGYRTQIFGGYWEECDNSCGFNSCSGGKICKDCKCVAPTCGDGVLTQSYFGGYSEECDTSTGRDCCAFGKHCVGCKCVAPTPSPTQQPTPQPTSEPTPLPTGQPVVTAPTHKPTKTPTTARPTKTPTTARPTKTPTTARPTKVPTTARPTHKPTTGAPVTTTPPPTPQPTPQPVGPVCGDGVKDVTEQCEVIGGRPYGCRSTCLSCTNCKCVY